MCGKYLVYREKIGDPPRSPTIFGKNIIGKCNTTHPLLPYSFSYGSEYTSKAINSCNVDIDLKLSLRIS
jgi:hypothetical protein